MTKDKIQLANQLLAEEERCDEALSSLRYFMGSGKLSLYGGDWDCPGEPITLTGILSAQEVEQVYQFAYSLVDMHRKAAQAAREAL